MPAVCVVFRATIHDTAAALRFGGDGAFVTFAIPENDIAKAVQLAALKKTPLRVTVEVDSETGGSQRQSGVAMAYCRKSNGTARESG